jgi:hypothetical protein
LLVLFLFYLSLISPAQCNALQPEIYFYFLGFPLSSPAPQEEPQEDGLGFSSFLPGSPAPQDEPQADGFDLGSSSFFSSSPAPHEPPTAIAVNPVFIKLWALFPAKNFSSPPFHAPREFSLLMANLLENVFYNKGFMP